MSANWAPIVRDAAVTYLISELDKGKPSEYDTGVGTALRRIINTHDTTARR